MSDKENAFAAPQNDEQAPHNDAESLIKIPHHLAKWFNAIGTIFLAASVYLFSKAVDDMSALYYVRLLTFIVGLTAMIITFMLKPTLMTRDEAQRYYQERIAANPERRSTFFPATIVIVILLIALLILLSD